MISKLNVILAAMVLVFSHVSFANDKLEANDSQSLEIWKTMRLVEITENVEIIHGGDKLPHLFIDNIACVFEQYNACSYYTTVTTPTGAERKLIVNLDQAAKLMKLMAQVGVPVDEDQARMDATSIKCILDANKPHCTIVTFQW